MRWLLLCCGEDPEYPESIPDVAADQLVVIGLGSGIIRKQ
jgi:hypothetical protein